MYKNIIFDIDGTLVDSVDLHARAWQEAFRHFGFQFEFEEVRHQIGKGSDKLIPHFLSHDDNQRLGEQLDEFRGQLWKREYFPKVRPFPRVRDLFERLKHDGKRVVLASSAKGDEINRYKQIANIEDLVDRETSSDDVEESKPAPDIVHAALKQLGSPPPETAIMIGDTPYDVTAARGAGVACIAVLCGGFPERELREAGCIAVYRDPADLLDHYSTSPMGREKAA